MSDLATRPFSLFGLLALCVVGATPVSAQESATLRIADVGVEVGGSIPCPVSITHDYAAGAQGLSFGLRCDVTVASIEGIAEYPLLQSMNGGAGPDFRVMDLDAGALGLGFVFSIPGTFALSPVDDTPVIDLHLSAAPGAVAGDFTSIFFANDIGTPPFSTVVVSQGNSFAPTLLDGSITICAGEAFIRGDVDSDFTIDIADAVATLQFLFGGAEVLCVEAVDVSADGALGLGDPILLLLHLFASGPAPAAPYPDCGCPVGETPLGCTVGCAL